MTFRAFLCKIFGHYWRANTIKEWRETGHNYVCVNCGQFKDVMK